MNWYRIVPCPNYAISEDGVDVKNITTKIILKHNTSSYAKDGLRRVTLRHDKTVFGKTKSYPVVFTIESLKQYIKNENKL